MSDVEPTGMQQPPTADLGTTEAYPPAESASVLVRVLDEYLAELQAGRAPNHERVLADHPELAQQLKQCLAGIDFVHRAGQSSGTPARLGDFRIVQEVGRGGMGVVYEAEQISLERKVALKVLRFGAVADPEAMQRFEREARTVAHLHHTNIVPIFAVGCEQGVHYYAMQFIEGKSLAEVLIEEQKGAKPIDAAEVARWGLQAAEALAHSHQRGVIHRDIKPSNLLLDKEGTLWLTDFGLARRADEVTLTAAGVLMGTPRYMSPEQATTVQQPIDHRTDIYSLGASLYELATGKPVFEAATPQGVLTQILHDEPVAPRLVQGTLPRDLETMILKCLAKEPARRYQSAQDLSEDLRLFLLGRAIKARRPSLAERAVRWARQHRRTASVAVMASAAAVLLAVAGTLGWLWYADWRLARVVLTSDGPPLTAELLSEDDVPVVPPFQVPPAGQINPPPTLVPAGPYRLRLSGPGLLSQSVGLLAERGKLLSGSLSLEERVLWPPALLQHEETVEVVDLSGRPDVILASSSRMRRLEGASGKAAWPIEEVKMTPGAEPALAKLPQWYDASQILQPYEDEPPHLVRPAPDLDRDGTRDLVWASRRMPLLLAVSGKTGKVLWWFLARPPMSTKELGESGFLYAESVAGAPAVAELDGDGTLDFIATFSAKDGTIWLKDRHSKRPARHTPPPRTSIEAISGRTGERLWRCDVDHRWFTDPSVKEDPHPAELISLDGKPVVVCVAGTHLVGLDPQTGKPLWSPHDLGFRPVLPPRLADLNGDGRTDLLLIRADIKRNPVGAQLLITMQAAALPSGASIWEQTLMQEDLSLLTTSPSGRLLALPLSADLDVVDLEGDGKPEVLFLLANPRIWSGEVAPYPRVSLRVLSGDSGEPRWERRLGALTAMSREHRFARLIVAPDLDGDGHREVVAASRTARDARLWTQDHALFVDALSGQDGRSLWRWEHPADPHRPQDPGALRWWQAGPDGWPLLVAPFGDTTFILETGTGRLAHVVEKFSRPLVADLDANGSPDLLGSSAQALSGGAGIDLGTGNRRVVVVRGTSPEVWRWLGVWEPATDLDGDGTTDLISRGRPSAISGRDGKLLRQPLPPHVKKDWPENTAGNRMSRGDRLIFDSAVVPYAKHRDEDLDGDGRAEQMRVEGEKLRVMRSGGKEVLWEWPVPDGCGGVIDVLTAKGEPTVVVQSNSMVYGLAALTGKQKWRCEGPGLPAGLLRTSDTPQPRILFRAYSPGPFPEPRYTVCRLPLATNPAGEYQAAAGSPRAYGPVSEDPRFTRPLPWLMNIRHVLRPQTGTDMIELLPAVVPLTMTLGLFAFWAMKRHWWKVGMLLGLALVLASLFAVIGIRIDARAMDTSSYYSTEGWYWIIVLGALAAGPVIVLFFVLRALLRPLGRRLRRLVARPGPA